MPAADSSPLCSVFTKSLGVRPAGTGLSLDRVILISVPTPWPKPALKHEWLHPSVAALQGTAISSRLFAAEPWAAEPSVELYERSGLEIVSYRWTVESPADVAQVVAGIAAAGHGAHGMAPIDVTVPTFLVCTQGSHDACCGTSGVELADLIERERTAYRVRRVSHTGGHRFSPTFLALPSGRMWAYADLALVDRVAAGAETADDLRMFCRGWLGAGTGAAQAAEIAARIHAGNPFVRAPTVSVAPDGDVTRCEVTVEGRTLHVGVHAGRQVPTIACEALGGMPVKVANELDWTVGEQWT